MTYTEKLKSGALVIQPELPLFGKTEANVEEEVQVAISEQVRLNVEAILNSPSFDTSPLLKADIQRVKDYLLARIREHVLRKGRALECAVDWRKIADSIVDRNLATASIFQQALDLSIAVGDSEGAPHYRLRASKVLESFNAEVDRHWKRASES